MLNVLGIEIAPVNIQKAIGKIDTAITNGKKGYITLTGVHGIIESQSSTPIKEAHRDALLSLPDGMPLVWIGWRHGFSEMDRCYGPDLMLALLGHSVHKGYTHFFYGGRPGVAEQLRNNMEKKFPGIQIVGTYVPPFRPLNSREEKELIELIGTVQPDIIWVGLSTPKQELFMHQYLSQFNTRLMIGVGAAFDFHTARVKQAPFWIQRASLEWFYRLLTEPRRLWKRYFKIVPLFLILYALQALNIKQYHIQK
jgi:N-acetylglucosaminyldiphosphoundecaprenol N-acetyl-beta-D-mannosaminyltransferase